MAGNYTKNCCLPAHYGNWYLKTLCISHWRNFWSRKKYQRKTFLHVKQTVLHPWLGGSIAFLKQAVSNVLTTQCQHLVAKHITQQNKTSPIEFATFSNSCVLKTTKNLRDSYSTQRCYGFLKETALFPPFLALPLPLNSYNQWICRWQDSSQPSSSTLPTWLAFSRSSTNLKSAISGFITKLLFHQRNLDAKTSVNFQALKNWKNARLMLHFCFSQSISRALKLIWNCVFRICQIWKSHLGSWTLLRSQILTWTSPLRENLLTCGNDFELEPFLNGTLTKKFGCSPLLQKKYPALWGRAKLFFIAFPTSYLIERGFSVVSQILNESRNRLDIVQRGDLRLRLTAIKPNIEELSTKHQIHPSH